MKKFKKILLMGVSYVLIAALAIGGTLAYLKDEDSAVNVMTLGNVYIEQIEQERDANGNLVDFKQGKPLYPAVFEGSSINWAPENEWIVAGDQAWKVVEENANVIDKFVTVKNIGKSAAYVRTLVAYEGDAEYGPNGAWIHVVANGSNVDPKIPNNFVGYITVKDVDYTVYEYVYPVALAAGETSVPSLKQVYMNNNADNDVVAYYGETYDILVLSQAVQAAGFTSADAALDAGFGDTTVENLAKWFDATELPVLVEDQKELMSAIKNGEKDIIVNNANVAISNRPSAAGADITFSGGTVDNGTSGGFNKGLIDGGTLVYNNVTIKGSVSLYGKKVVFNNCTFDLTGISDYIWTYGAKEVEFNNCTFNTKGKAILVYNEGAVGSSVVTVNSCIFNATAPAFAGASSVQPCAAIEVDSHLIPGTYTINVVGDNVIDSDFCGTVRIKDGFNKNNVIVNGVVPTTLVK